MIRITLHTTIIFLVLTLAPSCEVPTSEHTVSTERYAPNSIAVNDYLNEGGLLVFKKLEEERMKLYQVDKDSADQFIYDFVTDFTSLYPLIIGNDSSFDLHLQTVRIIEANDHLVPDSIWVYDVFKDMLLTPLGDSLHYLLNEKGYSAKKEPMATWLSELAGHKYYVNIPVSNWSKTWNYLKEGDFCYLWHKARTTYRKEASMLVFSGLSLLVLLIWLYRRWKKRDYNA